VFEIKNLGNTALNFHVAHRLQSVAAGAARSFDVEDIGEGVLRMFSSEKTIGLKAKTDEAEAKLHAALTGPRKKKSFSVTGNNRDSLDAALLEDARGRVREVVDEKPDKGGVDKGRFITDPANPKLPNPNESPPAQPKNLAPPAAHEPTPVEVLLAEENDPEVDLALKDLKRRAKDILGDEYPSGNAGRDDIVSALRAKVQ
jgi:hypothetical protein